MPETLPVELQREQARIEGIAREMGLTFFRVVFEMVDWQQMNELAAYGGFPTRYPHWRWGMEYAELAKSYEYGLHKIYEMVINNDPTYAYLLEGNAMVDQKLVMAHVYGHADFFVNNVYFSHTNRKMIDTMANHATRVRRHHERHGVEPVERFLDACLSVEDLIDPSAVFRAPARAGERAEQNAEEPEQQDPGRMPAKSYLDRYVNPPAYLEEKRQQAKKAREDAKRFPPAPERDVLGFILGAAPLEGWERDVVDLVRDESYYFLPQRQTKVMNEGWASYWHTHMMTTRILDDSEIIDYADHHSGTVATSPGRLNPYKLGLELFRDIERRWNMGQFGPEWEACDRMDERVRWDKKLGLGREKIFEVRRLHSDATFLDEYLTQDFCEKQGLFVSKTNKRTGEDEVESRSFDDVKQALLFQFTNGGRPVIEVLDANYGNRGELLLAHRHVGVDLRMDWAKEVLGNLTRIWKRPVRIETIVGSKPKRLGFDGEKTFEEEIEQAALKSKAR
jgi:stage V sporulation protein R